MPSETFHVFAEAVRRRFDEMSQGPLFVVDADREVIWATYLAAFPPGTNLMFRKRTEFDCSCCRGFIRNVGGVVAIENGAMSSIWDLVGLPHPYQVVADAMSSYVKTLTIRDVFLVKQGNQGTPVSREMKEGHEMLRWNHFAVTAPPKFVTRDLATNQGEARTTKEVLLRGLTELKPDAAATVADLISSNSLYRGEEHSRALLEFMRLQARVLSADEKTRELLAWTMIDSPAARFRNTVIGTLVQDLSDGVELERAVRSFEVKVAPSNYKRPTALITKAMVEAAMKTLGELGLEPALERRHAKLSDVSVDSVLFVDNSVRGKMKGGVEDLLMKEVKPAPFDPKKATEIAVEDFMSKVLPKCTSLSLYLDNGLAGNFVSMTAPVHEDSGRLFRWPNDFAWSYEGNVADSIKERVKKAGGKVEGVSMRVSLSWFNTDDLDLHVVEPSGNRIYFGNKCGKLDVDMNVGHSQSPLVRDPVENTRWVGHLPKGTYQVSVHNYRRRESTDVGFEVEVEDAGGLRTLSFDKGVPSNAEQQVAWIIVDGGLITDITHPADVKFGGQSKETWGLKSLDLIRVNSVVLSPNCWGDREYGNKHWFFILDGCLNPLPTRGIYNEFLSPELEKHRKVFEVLGDRMKCPPTDEQMSGLGFSSTGKGRVTVVAMGPGLSRPYSIVF